MIQQQRMRQKWPPWESYKKTTFFKNHLDDPPNVCGNVLWLDKIKVELFERCVVCVAASLQRTTALYSGYLWTFAWSSKIFRWFKNAKTDQSVRGQIPFTVRVCLFHSSFTKIMSFTVSSSVSGINMLNKWTWLSKTMSFYQLLAFLLTDFMLSFFVVTLTCHIVQVKMTLHS